MILKDFDLVQKIHQSLYRKSFVLTQKIHIRKFDELISKKSGSQSTSKVTDKNKWGIICLKDI